MNRPVKRIDHMARVVKFDIVLFGITVFVIGAMIVSMSADTQMTFASIDHSEIYNWGAYGIGKEGAFVHPQFLAVDENNGNVYVSDLGNKRVQKFDAQGTFLMAWGGSGQGNGQFNYLSGITTDGSFVYVADRDLNRIQKFDLDGNYVSQWGERGKTNGTLSMPNDVIASSDGYIYVVDTGNYRVQKFTTEGEFVLSFGGSGIEYGKFVTPHGIDIDDNDGSIYVSDRGNKRISQYMANGTYMNSYEFTGSDSFEFMPENIKLADDSMIYVTNAHSQNVLYLNLSDGSRPLAIYEQYGPLHVDRLVFPTDVELGINGQLYVIDTLDHTIYAYSTPQYNETTITNNATSQQQQQQHIQPSITENDIQNKTNDINNMHPIFYDTTPPNISAPPNIIVNATDILTIVDIGVANATDDYNIIGILNNAPEKFPIGTTNITWIAFDEAKNTKETYQFVTVLACGLEQSAYNVIYGNNGNELINGTVQDDLIFGKAGKDIIWGGDGNDCILGNGDDDIIDGGAGNDYIIGGTGNDILRGDTGIDTIYGGTGGDFLDGGDGLIDMCEQSDGLDLIANCEIFAGN